MRLICVLFAATLLDEILFILRAKKPRDLCLFRDLPFDRGICFPKQSKYVQCSSKYRSENLVLLLSPHGALIQRNLLPDLPDHHLSSRVALRLHALLTCELLITDILRHNMAKPLSFQTMRAPILDSTTFVSSSLVFFLSSLNFQLPNPTPVRSSHSLN